MDSIAIIDDSDINLNLLRALVSRPDDCEAILFQEAPAGLAWCCENRPESIIVDYMMPELDGMEFLARFRATPGCEETPVQRMVHFSPLICGALGLPAAEQQLMLQAAPIHDVGEIGIPECILLKPGKLTLQDAVRSRFEDEAVLNP